MGKRNFIIMKKNNISSAEDFIDEIFCKKDLLPSVPRENSNILNLLDEETIAKMENTNYRIVINISTFDFQTYLIYKDLPKGIDNLLTWEYEITGEYKIDKGSSFTPRKNEMGIDEVIKCDRIITKATVVVEDEILKQRSSQYISDFLSTDYNKIFEHDCWPATSFQNTMAAFYLWGHSSEFIKYLDDEALEEITIGRRFFIFANVSFKSELVDDTITMSHSMRGLGDLLSFERYLFKKCCDWASNSFYDFDQPVEFKYDSVEICFEM